jgi:hypothetical protein
MAVGKMTQPLWEAVWQFSKNEKEDRGCGSSGRVPA